MTVSTKLSDIWGAKEDIPKCVAPAVVESFKECAAFVHTRIMNLLAISYKPDDICRHLCISGNTYDLLVSGEFDRIKGDRAIWWVRQLADTYLPALSFDDHRKMLARRETIAP